MGTNVGAGCVIVRNGGGQDDHWEVMLSAPQMIAMGRRATLRLW